MLNSMVPFFVKQGADGCHRESSASLFPGCGKCSASEGPCGLLLGTLGLVFIHSVITVFSLHFFPDEV